VTALLEYLKLTFMKCEKSAQKITVQGVLMQNAVMVCTVFILLQYFGTCITQLINILENRPIMLAYLDA